MIRSDLKTDRFLFFLYKQPSFFNQTPQVGHIYHFLNMFTFTMTPLEGYVTVFCWITRMFVHSDAVFQDAL